MQPNPDHDHSNTWTAILLNGCGDELHRSNPIRDFYAAYRMLVNLGFRPVKRDGRIDFYELFDPHAAIVHSTYGTQRNHDLMSRMPQSRTSGSVGGPGA